MAKRDDFEPPPGVEYEGLSGIARDSIWLTQEDIPHDRDTIVTIAGVVRRNNVKFASGPMKEVVLSLRFVGKKRELGLNATNRKVLNALFGAKCAGWKGHTIILFVEQDVGTPQGPRPAVRIRARLPRAGDVPQKAAADSQEPQGAVDDAKATE
jgi:hypothetical protein